MVGGKVNPILRKIIFGMLYMILLVFPLAGVMRNHVRIE